jgi:hypothetical protein
MTDTATPQPTDDDFEEMLAGFDRLINDKELQQQLLDAGLLVRVQPDTCRHCSRRIEQAEGLWIDPEATGDDSVWRETCDQNDTFEARHEPTRAAEPAALDLLRRAKPHLYAVDRKGWCNCDITMPDSPHDPDCKWIADVECVGGLRVEIDDLLARLQSPDR